MLFGCLGFAPIAAKADVYELSGVVGTATNGETKVYTGDTISGTLTINPTSGVVSPSSFTVQNDPTTFTNFSGCPGACTTTFTGGYSEYGYLNLGSAPFTAPTITLGSGSYLYLTFDPNNTYAMSVTGTLTDTSAVTPEPTFYGLLALGLGGLFLTARNRRRSAANL
jgi:hypothetical protein